MLAPIFQDPTFNLDWMARNRRLRDAVAQGASSVGGQSYSASPSMTAVAQPSQTETANAVTATPENSQTKSSTEKSDHTKEESNKEPSEEPKKSDRRGELSPDEKQLISQLQTTDRRVRAHEQAHLNAAQGIAISGATFSYEVGPDDKRYAVGGEVSIDTSKESEPEKTIAKGNKIIRAALAPVDPSPQDHSVAANAAQMIQEAQAELMRNSYAQNQSNAKSDEQKSIGSTIDQQA